MKALHLILLVSGLCFQEIWTEASLSDVVLGDNEDKEPDDGSIEMVEEQVEE